MSEDRPTLDYAKPRPVPGHVDDLLKLNAGCLVASAIYFGWPIPVFLVIALRDGVPPWRAMPPGVLPWLVIPAAMLAVRLAAPSIRRWAARRAADACELRPGEALAEGEVLDRIQTVGKARSGLSLRVRFRVGGTVVTGTRQVSDRIYHRASVGGRVPVAVVPGDRRRWRVLDDPPD